MKFCPSEEGPTFTFFPFRWLKCGVHLTFGHFEPPDYLSDLLPLGIFYGHMKSFGLIVSAAFMLCLAVLHRGSHSA